MLIGRRLIDWLIVYDGCWWRTEFPSGDLVPVDSSPSQINWNPLAFFVLFLFGYLPLLLLTELIFFATANYHYCYVCFDKPVSGQLLSKAFVQWEKETICSVEIHWECLGVFGVIWHQSLLTFLCEFHHTDTGGINQQHRSIQILVGHGFFVVHSNEYQCWSPLVGPLLTLVEWKSCLLF